METPYLKVVGMPRQMGGKGAPKETVFGVLGMTKTDPYSKSLGGLVVHTTGGSKPSVSKSNETLKMKTDHMMPGTTATKISGSHYGQVPYAGAYMAKEGSKV